MIIALQTLVFFRQFFLTAITSTLRPFYNRLSLAFSRNGEDSEDEDTDDQVFSEFDEKKGVVFYPPVYAQRYAAVSDCLMDERWCGQIKKVVDFGYHDMSFIKYLKEVPGIQHILGVDIESLPLRCSSDVFDDYTPSRESPLQITLFQGNAADPDYRLIGSDAVIAIEMIEHMLPHDLERLVHTVFGFIKPWIAVFTTPNGDFNVLFNALEKNGLRRWDHFFEWSREQFNDWCSNIVLRYPNYTVTCRGVGPGPPGTEHYGCCSQLALFINKSYHKQQDLNINSLALVKQSTKPVTELYDWDTTDSMQDLEAIGPPTGLPSLTDFDCIENNRSQLAFMVSPILSSSLPIYAVCPEEEFFTNSDKTLQCNLDVEIAKSFLMFEADQHFDIRVPQKRVNNRVYEIEDVFARLNCSTFQMKKFSKTTQSLMAKNKIDSIMHTREVVDEIRNLTKALKFNKCIKNQPDRSHIWCNINWGENAPYWNEYYKIVREYNCPFQTKSEECRILDLITDEINRIIDSQFGDEMCFDANRVEIPLSHLVDIVRHITDDVDRVKEVLIWNGYELVDDVVIYSRMGVDTASVVSHGEDWQDNDDLSDWDNITEVHSTTVSEDSLVAHEYHDHRLRRALDQKVRTLRVMLTADEDIATELDEVVCKLMKLALRTSKGRATAPPAKWMQCKLLDLLTLTEKAIERRKKYYIEDTLKAIEFNITNVKLPHISDLYNSKGDRITNEIVDKYRHIIVSSTEMTLDIDTTKDTCNHIEDDFLSTTSKEFSKDLEDAEILSLSPVNVPSAPNFIDVDSLKSQPEKISIEKTQAWLNVDVEMVPLHNQEYYHDVDNTVNRESVHCVKLEQKSSRDSTRTKEDVNIEMQTLQSGTSLIKYITKREKNKKNSVSTRVIKKLSPKISRHYSFNKNQGRIVCVKSIEKIIKRVKENECLTIRTSKPIPESLIELCHPNLKDERCLKGFNVTDNVHHTGDVFILNTAPIETTEESLLVMPDKQETIARHRSVGTDPEEDISDYAINHKDHTEISSNEIDVNLFTRHEVSTETIESQRIFLNDIYEPSTSKGIRHNVSMDVQCGPDTLAAYPGLSASKSLVPTALDFSERLKIFDGDISNKMHNTEFGASTQDYDSIITSRPRCVGIKIQDSVTHISNPHIDAAFINEDISVMQYINPSTESLRSWGPENIKTTSEKQICFDTKTVNSCIRTELIQSLLCSTTTDSVSEFCVSYGSFPESSNNISNSPKTTSENVITNPDNVINNKSVENLPEVWFSKPILSCGGVHVHSYKDKQECEDIVYQGEWQRCRPKTTQNKIQNSIVAKKINESNRKQKRIFKVKRVDSKGKVNAEKTVKLEPKVEVKKQQRDLRLPKARQDTVTYDLNRYKSSVSNNIKPILNTIRTPRSIINVTKVASKIGMSTISSKNIKSTFSAKKLHTTVSNCTKDNGCKKQHSMSLQLNKQNKECLESYNLNCTEATSKIKNESLTKGIGTDLFRSKTPKLSKTFDFCDKTLDNDHFVSRKDKQESCEKSMDEQSPANTTSTEELSKSGMKYIKRALSPLSLNSSTCSSPNSIATVRAVTTKSKNIFFRKTTPSSNKSSFNNSESDNSTSNKARRVPKRCKSAKKPDSNKENLPTIRLNYACKENGKSAKSLYQQKSVCIAQLKTERSKLQTTPATLPKHKTSNTYNVKVPVSDATLPKKGSQSTSLSHKRSLKFSESLNDDVVPSKDLISFKSLECVNTVLVLKPQQIFIEPQNQESVDKIEEVVENSSLTNEMNFNGVPSNTTKFIRQLTEVLVDGIFSLNSTHSLKDSKTKVALYDVKSIKVDYNESLSSFKTVTTDYHTIEGSEIENSLNRVFDSMIVNETVLNFADTGLNETYDFDLVESSTPLSNRSEYFLADNDLDMSSTPIHPLNTSAIHSSVTDIYEPKELLVQIPPGFLSIQTFSGFFLDGQPVAGDQPDPISLFDSETGSLAVDVERLATSEELLISGRSSDSFESCFIDEDAVVPNWFFQINSQQQLVVDNQPVNGPDPEPIANPTYDVNGNPLGTGIIDVAAGAGDGRGIHSDQSQDSSGRGTSSFSSTDTLSSPQSEAILVNPLAFTTQYELLRGDGARSVIMETENNDVNPAIESSRSSEETDIVTMASHSHRPRLPLNLSEDIEADISSIDTDVPDSADV